MVEEKKCFPNPTEAPNNHSPKCYSGRDRIVFVDLRENINFGLYDAIIVGSGPAGATVARQLASRGKTVLVLESGGLDFDTRVQDSYAAIHGQGHFDSDYWPRHWIRALGGTSYVWGGWMRPLSERNMLSWPISRTELASWYDFAAAELGRNSMICTWRERGVPGFDLQPFSIGDPARYGAEAGKAIWSDKQVHLLLNATLSRLYPRQDRRGIERVTVFMEPDISLDIALAPHQLVILAAGGMGNAQILLGSTEDTNSAVGNETDQVGRYLMEHPHIYNCATLVVKEGYVFPSPPAAFGDYLPALVPDDANYAAAGGLDASFELVGISADKNNAIQRLVVDRLGGRANIFSLNARTEMTADPSNRVQRIFGADPSGLPRLRATCVLNAQDFRSILTYLYALGEACAEENIGRIEIINRQLFSEFTGGGHTMGTTRMGTDPRTSVVDKDCRVHGYSNLFVAGSSVFPTGGFANPTMTIVALAARLGDFLGSRP